jgi:predicted nucleotide-binding protein
MSRKTPPPRPTVPPSITPQQAIELLRRQREKAESLLTNRPLSKDSHDAWDAVTRDYLVRAFGSGSPNVDSVLDIGRYGSFPMNASEQWWENHRVERLQGQVVMLDALIETLDTQLELGAAPSLQAHSAPVGDRVFIVHGHDDAALQTTARFLEKLQLKTTILREEPNKGRTIIEKFIDYSNAGFAVVLLTADDRGGPKSAPYDEQKPRPRQNVLFELGFFVGKLGRMRVCALYQAGVEIPSDYQGVLFVQFDNAGAWKFAVAKEIKAAGIDIDLNNAV